MVTLEHTFTVCNSEINRFLTLFVLSMIKFGQLIFA